MAALPDLMMQFTDAVQSALPVIAPVFHEAVQNIKDVGRAFGSKSSFSPNEKIYHGVKLGAFTGLFALSALTLNVEGMIPSGIAAAEEIYTLDKEGEKIRHLADHKPGKKTKRTKPAPAPKAS